MTSRRTFLLHHDTSRDKNDWVCREEDKVGPDQRFWGLPSALDAVAKLVEGGGFAEDPTKRAVTVRVRVDLEDV